MENKKAPQKEELIGRSENERIALLGKRVSER